MSDSPTEKFQSLLKDFSNALLTTRANDGQLRCRPMVVAGVDENSDVWFVTSLDSAKVREIQADPQVCVGMQKGWTFLSLSGKASVVKDQAKLDELWSEQWKVWFPDGKADPSIILLKISAEEGEFWDNSGIQGLKYLFEAGRAYIAGERPDMDENAHQKVNLSK